MRYYGAVFAYSRHSGHHPIGRVRDDEQDEEPVGVDFEGILEAEDWIICAINSTCNSSADN